MSRSDNPIWTPRLDGHEGPIYRAIAAAIGTAIADGTLRPGERLPTHRALAEALGVDLTTVTRAYAEARRHGFLDATVGRGTFIRGATARAEDRLAEAVEGPVDLGMNLPPVPTDPPLPDLLQRGVARLLAGADVARLLTYRTGAGGLAERTAGAAWLRPTLGEVAPERILLTPGAQPALAVLLGTLAGRGDVILADALTYPGLHGAAALAGVLLRPVAGDAQGMLPEALEAACREHQPKAVYLMPTMHNPTTVSMPPQRREAIAGVALRHGLPIIEDDAYGLLPEHPAPAVSSFAPSLGFHVATVSKVISPALRLAWLVVPDARRAAMLTTALRATVLMASPLLSGVVTSWVADGTALAIRQAIRRECSARQALAREILPAEALAAHPEGIHVWLRLPSSWDRLDFAAHLRRRGLAVVPSDAFAVDPAAPPVGAVRLSLGAAPSRVALRGALITVAEALGTATGSAFEGIV